MLSAGMLAGLAGFCKRSVNVETACSFYQVAEQSSGFYRRVWKLGGRLRMLTRPAPETYGHLSMEENKKKLSAAVSDMYGQMNLIQTEVVQMKMGSLVCIKC